MDKLKQLIEELNDISASLSSKTTEISSSIDNNTNSSNSLNNEINKSLLALNVGIEDLNKKVLEMQNNKVWK